MTGRAATFDALYRSRRDPWHYETSAYERSKYAATLAALPAPHYRCALELGCSIGVLTAALARRCDRVVAVEVSEVALAAARTRLADAPVELMRADVPAEWPSGSFDLVMFSEILYFLSADEVATAAARAAASLAPGGHVVLVNWLGTCRTALSGSEAAEAFRRAGHAAGLVASAPMRAALYRIDVLSAP